MKLPAFQFYPGDWIKDPALRKCSLAARGLWIDLLCFMHESPYRGYLRKKNGTPDTPEQLARMCGLAKEEYQSLVSELIDCGVAEMSDDGALYSRRMARDETKRQESVINGKMGGNPRLKGVVKDGVNPPNNRLDNQKGSLTPYPSPEDEDEDEDEKSKTSGTSTDPVTAESSQPNDQPSGLQRLAAEVSAHVIEMPARAGLSYSRGALALEEREAGLAFLDWFDAYVAITRCEWNEKDRTKANCAWNSLSFEEKLIANRHTRDVLASEDWRKSFQMPVNYLSDKPWTRSATSTEEQRKKFMAAAKPAKPEPRGLKASEIV